MRKILFIAVLFAAVMPLWAQGPDLQGIGLSGARAILDTIVVNGRLVHVIGSVEMGADTEFVGVHVQGFRDDSVQVSFYDTIRPGGIPVDEHLIYIAPEGIQYDDSHYTPPRFWFAFTLPINIDTSALSMQLQFGIIGRLAGTEQEVYGLPKTSHAVAGTLEACQNPVDANHETFLRIEFDTVTESPALLEPDSGAHIGYQTQVSYTQPEPALRDSSTLTFHWVGGEPDISSPHIIYLSDTLAGQDKSISLLCTRLSESIGVDTVMGGDALVQNALYNLEFRYQDFIGNAPSSDSVLGLYADLMTEALDFVDPASGSSSQGDSLPVRYVLTEPASIVTLKFWRTAGETDSLHQLRLWEGGQDSGETFFWLNGLNIGTNNPYIDDNPHGEEDSLIRTDYTATVYDVSLRYQDTLGNPYVEVIHPGFIFGHDLATAPPILHLPVSNTAENAEFTISFTIPELPLENSVKVDIHEDIHGTWKGRTLVFGTLNLLGTYTIDLNGEDLLNSNFVTDISYTDGNISYNRLLYLNSYRVIFSYSDAAGHDSAASNIADSVIYDNITMLPIIRQPSSGTVFSSEDLLISYMLREKMLNDVHRMIFTQTGGVTPDHNSPHILYPIYDPIIWNDVYLHPLDLWGSEDFDSMNAGQTLLPNSIYELSIEYQDTLANPASTRVISHLTFLTGATIAAQGEVVSGGVLVTPGEENIPFFRLTLVAEGGAALLQGVLFDVTGTATDEDFVSGSIQLWESLDSLFDPTRDLLLMSLQSWTPPQIDFSGLSAIVPVEGRTYFFTGSFDTQADQEHSFQANITEASSINCAGDPVTASHWPLGQEDSSIDVKVLTFQARADSVFDALLLVWRVASEQDNWGFNIWRSETPDTGFIFLPGEREDLTVYGIGNHPDTFQYTWLDDGVEGGKTYYYRLESVGINQDREFYEYTISGTPMASPSDYQLLQNRPNPFNGSTLIEYIVPTHSRVYLIIYDILGRRVRTLVDGQAHNPALYRVIWDGRNESGGRVASGIYFYQMRGERGFSKARKMLFIQ